MVRPAATSAALLLCGFLLPRWTWIVGWPQLVCAFLLLLLPASAGFWLVGLPEMARRAAVGRINSVIRT
jgi:hypothetical protein